MTSEQTQTNITPDCSSPGRIDSAFHVVNARCLVKSIRGWDHWGNPYIHISLLSAASRIYACGPMKAQLSQGGECPEDAKTTTMRTKSLQTRQTHAFRIMLLLGSGLTFSVTWMAGCKQRVSQSDGRIAGEVSSVKIMTHACEHK
jgi:hypothetical protein